MTSIDFVLIARFYQISKICAFQLEYFIPKIQNRKLQTILSNIASNFEILSNECHTLAKAQNINLPDHLFFKRCQEIVDESMSSFDSISLQSVVVGLTISRLNTLIELYNVEQANSETINIGRHLQELLENQINILKQIKL